MVQHVSDITERKQKIKRALENVGVSPDGCNGAIILSHFDIAVQRAFDAGRESVLSKGAVVTPQPAAIQES